MNRKIKSALAGIIGVVGLATLVEPAAATPVQNLNAAVSDSNAAIPSVEKIWWRRPYYGHRWGWRRPYYGYGWHRRWGWRRW